MRRAIRAHLGDFIAMIVLAAIALGVAAYILVNQESRPQFPWESSPFVLKGEFSTAQAVTPGQGQSVRVAGVQVGKIAGVKLQNGAAVVSMNIDAKWVKKLALRSDATLLLRPRTGLKDMFIELDPGGAGERLRSGDTLPISNTAPDINPDEQLSVLDSDTRQYLELLINGGGKGLQGHGNDLNALFKALTPTNRELRELNQAIAQRHRDLAALVHFYGDLTNTLADRDQQIRTLINSADVVFRAYASENQNISQAIAELPGALRTTEATLTKLTSFAPLLSSTLCCGRHSLTPAFRELDVANREQTPFMRIAFPILKNQIRPFIQVARPFVRELRPTAINLANATPDLTASFHELNRFFDMLAYNPQGRVPVSGNPAQDANRDQGYSFWLAWVAENTDSLFSTSDANGPFRRAYLSFNCTSIQTLASLSPQTQALVSQLLGLTNALGTGLCTGSSQNPALPGGLLPLAKTGSPGRPKQNGASAAGAQGQGAPPATPTQTAPTQSAPTQTAPTQAAPTGAPRIPTIPTPTTGGR